MNDYLLIYFIKPLQILNKLNVCLRDQFIVFYVCRQAEAKAEKILTSGRSRKAKLSNHLYFQMQADRMGRTLSRLLGTVSRSWFCRNLWSHCIRMATTFSRLISRPDQLCYLEYCAWHNGPTYWIDHCMPLELCLINLLMEVYMAGNFEAFWQWTAQR